MIVLIKPLAAQASIKKLFLEEKKTMPEIEDLPKELIDEIRTTFKIFDQDDGKL